MLTALNTRVVVPLLPADIAPKPAATLNPVFELDSGPRVMVTQWMAAVPANILKTHVANLAEHRNEIAAALDLLFRGF